jgi:hypothetical protein
MSTTPDSMQTATRSREQSARFEPLRAEPVAPGMFAVSNLRSGSTYTVDIREGACECEDFTYRMGPAGGACKHLAFVRLVAEGELGPRCGYATCRPSCPERSTPEEDH